MICQALLWPAQPMTEPAGCVPALAEYRPGTGVAYGIRARKLHHHTAASVLVPV